MVFVQWIDLVVSTAFMLQLTMVFSGSLISLLAYGASAPVDTCLMSNDFIQNPRFRDWRAQQSRLLAMLAHDWISVLSWYITAYNSTSEGSGTLFWFLWRLHSCA